MTKADTYNVTERSKSLKNICIVISFYKFQKHAKLNNSLRIQTIRFKYEENTKFRLPLKWEGRGGIRNRNIEIFNFFLKPVVRYMGIHCPSVLYTLHIFYIHYFVTSQYLIKNYHLKTNKTIQKCM